MPERYGIVDPSRFPSLTVVDVPDQEAILSDRMAAFKARWAVYDAPMAAQYDVEVLEFDPVKINQEVNTAMEVVVISRMNNYARATTLAFAWGDNLDAIASRYPGGVPRLASETYANDASPLEITQKDNAYRRRIWLSPNTLAAAGTSQSYQYWALTVDGDLRDATAVNPRSLGALLNVEPGTIYLTMQANGANPIPSQERILAVRAFIQREEIGQLTDIPVVQGPRLRDTEYYVRFYNFPSVDRATSMAQVTGRLATLVEDQRFLGQDHTVAAINAAALATGVSEVEVIKPAATVRALPTELVRVTNVRAEFGGYRE